MKQKVVIMGGGIGGIVSAYYEAKKNNKVILIESAERIGGLLKSDFNGKMNNKSCYVDTSILSSENEYNRGCRELVEATNEYSNNLEKLIINKIGQTFYDEIISKVITKYTGLSPKDLDNKVGEFFDMSRLLVFDDDTTKKLCEIDTFNSKLGHHSRLDGSMKYYPKFGGVGKIIELLEETLIELGVEIKTNMKVLDFDNQNGHIKTVITTDETFNVDKVVWTLASGQLLSMLNIQSSNKGISFLNAGLYDFTFDKPIKSESTFINVYDTELLSGRVTLYQNLSKNNNYSCTVEVLSENDNLKALMNDIYNELLTMGLIDKSYFVEYKNYREIKNGFPILTKQFVKTQKETDEFCKKYFKNVVFSGRATAKEFFMPEVLVSTYNTIKGI